MTERGRERRIKHVRVSVTMREGRWGRVGGSEQRRKRRDKKVDSHSANSQVKRRS